MYEDHDETLFGWNNINCVLMGLETSLMTSNATAHVSGIDNRTMRSKRNKGRNLDFRDFQNVPTDVAPRRKCPVLPNIDPATNTDVPMPDAAQTPNPTEGKVVDPVTPSTDARRGSSSTAPSGETSKRRRISTARDAQNLMNNSYGWIQRLLSNYYVCHSCGSTDHLIVDCPIPEQRNGRTC